MITKDKKITIRNISIGAIIGIAIGGTGTVLVASVKSGVVNMPFIIDEVPIYPVTTQEFYIDSLSSTNNIVEEKEPVKSKKTFNDVFSLNDVEIKITSPYKEQYDTRGSINRKVTDSEYVKETTTYAFELLTEEEKEEKINSFKEGNIELAIENYDSLSETEEEIIYLTEEELEKKAFSASIIINNVDYKNKEMVNESEVYNIAYSVIFSTMSIIAGSLGALCADIIDEKEDKENVKKKRKH